MTNRETGTSRTLVSMLRQQVTERPDHIAYRYLADGSTETQQLSHANLDRQATAIARRLHSLGSPGEAVALLYGSGLEAIAAFFGCQYAGMLAVPLIPPRLRQPLASIAAVLADTQTRVVMTTSKLLPSLQTRFVNEPALKGLTWLATDDLGEGNWTETPAWQEPATDPDDVATLLYTSGSTSTPKGVMLSHEGLMGAPFTLAAGLDPNWVLNSVSWLPLYHIAGLTTILAGLQFGNTTTILMPPEVVLAEPRRWLQAISDHRALMAAGPNFLYQLCIDRIPPAERGGLDLSAWRIAGCTAEPVRAETLEQFAVAFAPYGFRREAFLPAYALSESAGVASRSLTSAPVVRAFARTDLARNRVTPAELDAPGAVQLVSNGRPGAGTQVRIVEPTSRTICGLNEVGEIWVASAYSARGYWHRPAETAETFQAFTADTHEGPFLRTGDLGFLYEGEVYICGRLKEMIIIRGQNYYAQDIEAAVAGAHPDLGAAAAAFAVTLQGDEHLVLYHELRPDCPGPDVAAMSAAIRQAVARVIQLPVYAVVLVQVDSLPKTALGKVQRYLCRDDFLDQLRQRAAMRQPHDPDR